MANELSNLHPVAGERKERMRIGRGEGSGKGKTSGRGTKGAGARSGASIPAGFEGGQMPLHRRLPKFGFKNPFSKDFVEVNLERLASFAVGSVVDAEALKASGVIARIGKDGVKVLGRGELAVALHVRVAKLTKSAAEKIIAAGGTVDGPLPGE